MDAPADAYKKSHWNYRVVQHSNADESWVEIHEVYYRDGEPPHSMTSDGVGPHGETVDGLRWSLQKMLDALNEPVFVPPPEWDKK